MKTDTRLCSGKEKSNFIKIKSLLIGFLFYIYLFIADFAIPGVKLTGHYNTGNNIVGALFFSYSSFAIGLQMVASPAMFVIYSYIAFQPSLRKAGKFLYIFHYAFAIFFAIPFYLQRDSNLWSSTKQQFILLVDKPLLLLFCFAPFLLANVFYVWLLLYKKVDKH